MLNEVHLLANGAFADDVVPRLEDLEAQLGQHGGHKVGIRVGKQWHGGHQLSAVKVDDLLLPRWSELRKGGGGEGNRPAGRPGSPPGPPSSWAIANMGTTIMSVDQWIKINVTTLNVHKSRMPLACIQHHGSKHFL